MLARDNREWLNRIGRRRIFIKQRRSFPVAHALNENENATAEHRVIGMTKKKKRWRRLRKILWLLWGRLSEVACAVFGRLQSKI